MRECLRGDNVLPAVLLGAGLSVSLCVPDAGATTTLIDSVSAASESNVVFSDAGSGIVDVTFSGMFDFSTIGGSIEPYSGAFSFDTSTPPYQTVPGNPDIARYDIPASAFDIFGGSVTPLDVDLLVQDGAGSFNDFFTLQVTLDVFNGPGVPIPGTDVGLIAIGLNAGAFPPTMLSSADFPTDLDVFATSTPNAPTQFAVVTDDLGPVDAAWLGGDGNWSAANWGFDPAPDSASYPDNDAGDTFDVTIGGGNVTLDVDATIDGLTVTDNRLTLAGGRTLTVSNGGTARTFSEIDVPTGSLLHFDGDLQQADADSLTFVNGELSATDYHLDAGFLLGNGTVRANLHVGDGVLAGPAVVAPGNSPGGLTIDGDVILDVDGVLQIQLGGPSPGDGYDVFTVLGDLVLNGTVLLQFVDGFAPLAGQSFDFLDVAGVLSGAFSDMRVAGLQPGFEFDTTQDEGVLTLTALSDGIPVPAPAGILVLWPALLITGRLRARTSIG